MGSSTQMAEDLQIQLIHDYKAREEFKKISKHFQFTIFTIQNVIVVAEVVECRL